MTTIIEALNKLDVKNDAHWTADGLPKVETVQFLMNNKELTRADISKAAAGFSRATAGAGAVQTAASDTATDTNSIAAPAGAAQALDVQTGGSDEQVHTEATQSAGGTEPATEGASLEAQLHAAQERLADIEQAFVQANRIRDEARAEVDRLTVEYEASGEKEDTGSTIQQYLASQARELVAQGEKVAKLREAGIDPALLTAALGKDAPIDAAFARKTGFGNARPMYNAGAGE